LAISLLFIIEANDLLIDYYSTIENKVLFKTFAVIGDNSEISLQFPARRKPLDVKFELVRTINKIDRLYFGSIKTEKKMQKI
jgi:hypothetical protein